MTDSSDDTPTVEDYFYYIPPIATAYSDIALRRDARKMFKTYFTIPEIAHSMMSKISVPIREALHHINFDATHQMALYLLLSVFTAYGVNDENYPHLVNGSITDSGNQLMIELKNIMTVPVPRKNV